jgi:hemin uptake protein HemP
MNTNPSTPCLANEPAKAGHEAKLIRSQDWFGRSSVVFIEHKGERYQLRQTRNGKLILTK